MSTDTQTKNFPIETTFYATFKPSVSVSESQVELNINGVWGATVHARGFTPKTELKGKIRMQPNITEQPNSYLIARVGDLLVFLFLSRGSGGPALGGATFAYPFTNDIDWHGNLDWKPLVPIPSKMDGLAPNATPDGLWHAAPITITVVKGAVSQTAVAKVTGGVDFSGPLKIDSDINANPPLPSLLSGVLWYQTAMFGLGINSWQLTAKQPGGYYLTFAPDFSSDHNLLGYAHLYPPSTMDPTPGDWHGNIVWYWSSQSLLPAESNEPITLSPDGTATVGSHVTNLPGLNDFFDRILHTGNGPVDVHGRIHADQPSQLFGKGTWVMQVHRANIPPGDSIFAVLTFYSVSQHDLPRVVGQATFHGMFDNPRSDNPPTEWSGEYSWRSTVPTLDPPKNLPLTAEITLVLPNVAIRFREITANFGDWSAVLPNDFAKFFIDTPYQFPLNLLSPKIVAGTLVYEPSLIGVENRWKVETAHGSGQAVMTLYSALLGPLLPLGFAIFNGTFPAGKWEGTLEWKKRLEDRIDEPTDA